MTRFVLVTISILLLLLTPVAWTQDDPEPIPVPVPEDPEQPVPVPVDPPTQEPAPIPEPGGVEIDSKEGRFRVVLPSGYPEPEVTNQDLDTMAGKINMTMFMSEGKGLCMVAFNDYPAEALGDPKANLDGARDGALKNMGATLDTEQDFTLNGFPGRRITFHSAQFFGRIDYVLADERLYQVGFLAMSRAEVETPEIETYFTTFILTQPTEPPAPPR